MFCYSEKLETNVQYKNIYFKILLEKLEDSIPNLKMVNLFLERGCGILNFYSKYASYLIRKRVEVKKNDLMD